MAMDLPEQERRVKLRNLSDTLLSLIDNQPVRLAYYASLEHQDTDPAGCSKRPSSKAAGESKPEAYPRGYVEDFDEPRTPLANFFSILLNRRMECTI